MCLHMRHAVLTLLAYYVEQGLCNGPMSVRLSVPSSIGCCSSVRRVCCWAPRRQEISSTAVGAGSPAVTSSQQHGFHCSKCGQRHVGSCRRSWTQPLEEVSLVNRLGAVLTFSGPYFQGGLFDWYRLPLLDVWVELTVNQCVPSFSTVSAVRTAIH